MLLSRIIILVHHYYSNTVKIGNLPSASALKQYCRSGADTLQHNTQTGKGIQNMCMFINGEQAADLVRDDMTIAVGGFITYGVPEDCLVSLQSRYVATKSPRNLTLLHLAAVGDGAEGGANRLGEPGLCKRLICGHIGMEPRLNKLVVSEQLEAFLIPQGVASHLSRAIAGKKPGVLTHVGLQTYCDPRLEGCKANQSARDSGHAVVELLQLNGEDYLLYRSMCARSLQEEA